jgi:hypothetical protein
MPDCWRREFGDQLVSCSVLGVSSPHMMMHRHCPKTAHLQDLGPLKQTFGWEFESLWGSFGCLWGTFRARHEHARLRHPWDRLGTQHHAALLAALHEGW